MEVMMPLSSAVSANTKVHDIVDVSMPSTKNPRDVDGPAPMVGQIVLFTPCMSTEF